MDSIQKPWGTKVNKKKWTWATAFQNIYHWLIPTVKRYVRKGISNEYRGLVWMYVSGAEAMKEQNPGMYQRLLDGPKDAELMEVIKTGWLGLSLVLISRPSWPQYNLAGHDTA